MFTGFFKLHCFQRYPNPSSCCSHSSPPIRSLSSCSITVVRKMTRRWTWPPWRDQTLSLTFHAMPATPSPWTARPSLLSLWISWTRALTTAPAVHRTLCPLDSQMTCVTEGSGWASILTTRTPLSLFPCRFTLRAPPL